MSTSTSEDLRGRHFTWEASDGDIAIIEDPVVVGQVVRLADRPSYLAEIAGERLMVEHSVGALGPTFEVRDTSDQTVRIWSRYTREAEMRAMVGSREYALRRSGDLAVWSGGEGDAVSLRVSEAFVLMGADPGDAAALLILGIVMVLESSLFPAPRVRGL